MSAWPSATALGVARAARSWGERLESGVGLLKGAITSRNRITQLKRLALLARHLGANRGLRKALLYHRYVTALLLAQRLGLFALLSQMPRTTSDVASAARIGVRAADVLLRVLEAQGFVVRREGCYALTEFAREFLAPEGALSYAPMLEFLCTFTAAFDDISAGLASGTVPPRLDVFSSAADVAAMLAAVNAYLDAAGRELVARAHLPDVRTAIVGSMGVSFSAIVLERYPHARVTYGCLEHLVAHIPELRERYGVDASRVDGMHCHGGEPKDDKWGDEAFDLVFLTKKMILRPDERLGEKFARKAFEVLNPGGVAIFWEAIHGDAEPTPLVAALESVLDLGVSPTGCVWTREAMREMLLGIGFGQVEMLSCLGGETTFVVARK